MTDETYRSYLIREFPGGYTVVAPDGFLVLDHDHLAPTLAAARAAADEDAVIAQSALLDAMRY